MIPRSVGGLPLLLQSAICASSSSISSAGWIVGGQQRRGFAKVKLKKKNLFPKNPYLKVKLPPNQGPMPYKYQLPKLEYHRFTGNRAQKCAPIKTLFQMSAEKEFLLMRAQRPAGFVYNLSGDDLSAAPAELRQTLSLACASEKQVSKFRRYQLLQKFQRSAFDTGSLPVKIAILTERILNMRATNILQERNTRAKQAIKMALCRRNRVMKALFIKDFELYKWVVKQLGLRLIRFNYMALKDPSKTVNAIAVDGDKVKWMLQQRLWRHRYRPRNVKHPQTGKLVRYTRHLVKPPPANFGKPVAVKQQISKRWPYGVKPERVSGTYTVYNPAAPGRGFGQPSTSGRWTGRERR